MVRIGENKRLGKFIVMEDDYGNRFTYAGLGSLSKVYAGAEAAQALRLGLQARDPGQGQDPDQAGDPQAAEGREPEASGPGGSGKVATSSHRTSGGSSTGRAKGP